MKIKNKFCLGLITIFTLCIILQPNKVNAALQSNGGTATKKTIGDWILQIRQMQELGGTLGRTDTINKTDLSSDATDLDIHMEKNTEYGAMAILSASAYGNPNKINDGDTTTGNVTGVVMRINNEMVSAGSLTRIAQYVNAKSRYKNEYTKDYVAKVGDAILQTKGWHGSTNNEWINYDTSSLLVRAHTDYEAVRFSIFSYCGVGTSEAYLASYASKHHARACIVVGTGI